MRAHSTIITGVPTDLQIKREQDVVLGNSPSAYLSAISPLHSKLDHNKVKMVPLMWESLWSLIPEPLHIPSIPSAKNPLSIPLLTPPHSLELTSSHPLNLSFF